MSLKVYDFALTTEESNGGLLQKNRPQYFAFLNTIDWHSIAIIDIPLQEVSDLQKQINERLVQHSQNQGQLDELQMQVKEMESKILEKSAHITDIEKDLKDGNLDQFNQVPGATEGESRSIA